MNIIHNIKSFHFSKIFWGQLLWIISLSQISLVIYPFDRFYQWILFTVPLLLGYCLLPKDKSKFKIGPYEIVFATFIGYVFLSGLWATNYTLIWDRGFYWIFLFMLFLIFVSVDYRKLDISLWKWSFIIFIIINLIYIFYACFITYTEAPYSNFQYLINNKALHRNFHLKGNLISSILILQFVSLIIVAVFSEIKKKYLFPILMLISIAILLMYSKGSLFIFPVAIVSILIVMYKHHWKTLIIGLGSLALISFIIFFFNLSQRFWVKAINPFLSLNDDSNDERLNLWSNTVQLIVDDWLLGVGAGNWLIEHGRHGFHDFHNSFESFELFRHAHNMPLEYASELGLIGLLMIQFILVFPFFYNNSDLVNRKRVLLPKVLILSYLLLALFYGIVYDIDFRFCSHLVYLIIAISIVMGFGDKKNSFISLSGSIWIIPMLAILSLSWIGYKTYINDLEVKYLRSVKKKNKNLDPLRLLEDMYHPVFNTFYKSNSIDFKLAQYYFNHDFLNDAKAYNIKAIQSFPNHYYYPHKLGEIYFFQSDYDKAIDQYNQSLKINKTFVPSILGGLKANESRTPINIEQKVKYLHLFEDRPLEVYGKFYNPKLNPDKVKNKKHQTMIEYKKYKNTITVDY